jgi:hypothetical protein
VKPIEGGCLCGAIRYRALGRPYDITHCHCATCRRASGAPFVTWASVDTDKFKFVNGKPTSYASSVNVIRTFCNQCGTALTYQRADAPGAIDITAGSMDDPSALAPEDHTWTERQLPWILLRDGLPQYARERKRE